MPTQIDICNAALGCVGTRSTIAAMNEPSVEAVNCSTYYDFARRGVLRSYAWSFARKQVSAALLAAAQGTPENPNGTVPIPLVPVSLVNPAGSTPTPITTWQYEYAYPQDCLRMRHQEWPQQQNSTFGSTLVWTGNYPPLNNGSLESSGQSSTARKPAYEISTDLDSLGNTIKVILSNLEFAIFVYTMDATNVDQFDAMFEEAFIWALAAKLVGPLTGDDAKAKLCAENAMAAVMKAKVADANESPTNTDHVPDWIRARGYAGGDGLEWYDLDVTGAMLNGGV